MRRLSTAELEVYDHVPPHVAARALVVRSPVLAPGTEGMALGRFVVVRGDRSYHGGNPDLIAHELVHVLQWADLGVAGFLWRYLSSYASNLLRLRRHGAAYLAIPLEVEARAATERWARAHRPGA